MNEERHAEAKALVDRFISHFEESYRLLAYYAALPLLLTPELLNFLRGRFLRGQVPWVAEADLLLSDLCRQVGYELYAIKPAVRAYLLAEMAETVGREAMQAVARLLITYTQYLEKLDPRYREEERQAQQWAAMVYLDESREQAVQQMATALRQQVAAATTGDTLLNELEANRLTRLVEALAPELSDYQELVDFAIDVNSLVRERSGEMAARIREKQSGRAVAGVSLEVDEGLLSAVEAQETAVPPTSQQPIYQQTSQAAPPDFTQTTIPPDVSREIDPRKLLNALDVNFNEVELRDLCFDLEVDYVTLPADGKQAKARELIIYFTRRNRLDRLVNTMLEHRPNILRESLEKDEPDIFAAKAQISEMPVSEETAVDATALTQLLMELFNEEELRDLCFILEVDYDGLPIGGQQTKARSLVEYCVRHRRLSQLVEAVREERPFVTPDRLSPDPEIRQSAAQQTPSVSLDKLNKAVLDLFDEAELEDLCFDLAVDYDNLAGRNKFEKSASLTQFLQRRQRLPDFLDVLRKFRPEFDVDSLVLTEDAGAQSAVGVGGTAVPDKSDTPDIDISALVRLMSQPEFRSAVVEFQTDFGDTIAQIDILTDYKLAHDLFQELESRYVLLKQDEKRLPSDEAWDNISLTEPDLQGKINDLLNVIKRPTFSTDDTRWVQQLEKAGDQIRIGVEEFDLKELQSGTRSIYRVLNQQPSRLNAQIVAAASTIRIDSLGQAIRVIFKNLDESGNAIKEIKQGIESLTGLNERLNQLVREHNSWQEIDDELRRVEASMDQGIEELEDAWFDLGPMLRELLESSRQEEWAAELLKVVEVMGEALGEGTAVTINRQFRQLRSLTSRRFRQVDLELLSLLQELQRVGEPVDLLLRQLLR